MVILATLFFLHGAGLVGSMPGAGAPENLTIVFLSPNSVKVSWSTSTDNIEKYDVYYKPTNVRTSDVVAGNSNFITLRNLEPNTQYQVTVVAVKGGKRYRSRPTIFLTMGVQTSTVKVTSTDIGTIASCGCSKGRTAHQEFWNISWWAGPSEADKEERLQPPEPPNTSAQRHPDSIITGVPTTVPSDSEDVPSLNSQPQNIQVRGVEVGIVLLVLVVWIGAIALFFNRWGKIRMLLPYQPDYKEQLKVPGSGVCAAGGGPCTGQQHGSSQGCPQHLHWSSHQHFDFDQWPGPSSHPASRPRVNSAIYISSALGTGERDSEFGRYLPLHSQLWRRTRSAENIPLSGLGPQQFQQRDPSRKSPIMLPVLSISGPSPPEQQADQHF